LEGKNVYKTGSSSEANSRRALYIFIIVATLMLGLSFAGGPDPRLKIYILATQETANSLSNLIRTEVSSEIIIFTPQDEFNDLDLLVKTKTVKMILIADFPFIWSDEKTFLSFLESVIVPTERVIIVKSFQNYDFASRVKVFLPIIPEKSLIMSEPEICNGIRLLLKDARKDFFSYE